MRANGEFSYSISCTTRSPRNGEVDGKDYFFVSREEFERRIAAGELLEWAQVHGNYYGTPRDFVMERINAGRDILMDLDVQGARNIRECDAEVRKAVVDVFLMPPSMEVLRTRLLRRATESESELQTRLQNARTEMAAWREYRYVIISGSPEDDVTHMRSIVGAERMNTVRLLQGE